MTCEEIAKIRNYSDEEREEFLKEVQELLTTVDNAQKRREENGIY